MWHTFLQTRYMTWTPSTISFTLLDIWFRFLWNAFMKCGWNPYCEPCSSSEWNQPFQHLCFQCFLHVCVFVLGRAQQEGCKAFGWSSVWPLLSTRVHRYVLKEGNGRMRMWRVEAAGKQPPPLKSLSSAHLPLLSQKLLVISSPLARLPPLHAPLFLPLPWREYGLWHCQRPLSSLLNCLASLWTIAGLKLMQNHALVNQYLCMHTYCVDPNTCCVDIITKEVVRCFSQHEEGFIMVCEISCTFSVIAVGEWLSDMRLPAVHMC